MKKQIFRMYGFSKAASTDEREATQYLEPFEREEGTIVGEYGNEGNLIVDGDWYDIITDEDGNEFIEVD